MHELSICRAISAIVEDRRGGREVESVCLDVGGLRQVVPQTLEYCWEIATREGPLDGAALSINAITPQIRCRACGATTVLEHPVFRCGRCGGTDTAVDRGDELMITSLVLKEE